MRWAWACISCPTLPPSLIIHTVSEDTKHHEREKGVQIRSWKYFFCVNIDGWHNPFIIYVILYLYYRFLCSITCLCCCRRKYFGVSLHLLKLMSLILVKLNCPVRNDYSFFYLTCIKLYYGGACNLQGRHQKLKNWSAEELATGKVATGNWWTKVLRSSRLYLQA